MDKLLRILILEDSEDDVALIDRQLKREGTLYTSKVVENKTDYEKALKSFEPDVVIADHGLPQFDSLAALQIFHSYQKIFQPSAVFILVTGTVSEEFAVQIMKEGADDYILKDRLKRLPAAINNSVEKNRLVVQQRKMEEEKLHLLDILQKSLHEIYVLNAKTLNFEYINEEALDNLGYTSEEMYTMTPSEILSDHSKERLKKMLTSVEKSRKGRIYEAMAIRKDGSQYPIQIHLQAIKQGRIKKYLANVLDITESKQIEQQKEFYTFVQDSFDAAESLQESLERIMKRLCESYKIPASEIWLKDFENCDVQCYASYNEKNINPQTNIPLLAESAFRSGETLVWESPKESGAEIGVRAFPIKSGKEVVAVIIGYTQGVIKSQDAPLKLDDVIVAKLAANIKRRKTEEELRKIFDFSPDVLAIAGKDGYWKKINPSLSNILGFSTEELLSKPIRCFIYREDHKTFDQWEQTSLQEDEVEYYENRYLTSNGGYRWFGWSVTPLKEGLHFAVGKDITEHKEQVRAIKRQNKRLSEIAWEQSHIVRAPLTRLLACVEFLEEEEKKNREVLSSIKTSAYELDKILKGIVNKTENV